MGAIRSWATLAVALLSFAAIGCGPDPEKAGDKCDPGDGCPAGLLCQPYNGDDVCLIPAGQPCDPAAPETFCENGTICGTDDSGNGFCGIAEGGACDPANDQCAGGLTCAELEAGGNACYPPVLVQGMVFDAVTAAAIAGARVMALDDQKSAMSEVAISDAAGNYVLEVPIQRDASGAPIAGVIFTLRASAQDYQTFPGGVRPSLPIVSSEAMASAEGWIVHTAITDIALIALPADQQGLGSIAGRVDAGDESGGVLVVAEDGTGKGWSDISDIDGSYVIFNVPDGSYTVSGYAAFLQLEPVTADVAGAALTGVNLVRVEDATGSFSGDVNIVNAPGGAATSVVLVVQSTFERNSDDTYLRGEVPRGLRTPLTGPPDVTGAFTIEGVPAGTYVVLAAFENDDLVRDPDFCQAGTDIVTDQVMARPGTDVTISQQFKVTEALATIGPGVNEPEAVNGNVTLEWADDSGEQYYTVSVFNALGDLVWCQSDAVIDGFTCQGPNVPGVSGNNTVTVAYDGPLDPGMYYQFRATSWSNNDCPISQTEDLRGVFYVPSGM